MNISLQKRINSYALAAGCFLYLNQEASGQVIYTDVDPDIILTDGAAEIDMDNNGVFDFFFHNNSFLYYSTSWSSFRTMKNILVGPDEVGNALEGISASIYTGYGTFTRYYPFALDHADIIGESKTWQSTETQIMALRVFSDDGDLVGLGFYCYWSEVETIDKYLGVRFKDFDGQNHYGWIRCDVLDEGRTLIIKDYAYEAEPDYPVIAGDTIQYVSIHENNSNNNLSGEIYSSRNIVYVSLNELQEEVEIYIYDAIGKLIYLNNITNKSTHIELREASGIYIVELISGKDKFTKNIFIDN